MVTLVFQHSQQQHSCVLCSCARQYGAQNTAQQMQPQQPAGTDASRVADLSATIKQQQRLEQCEHQLLVMPDWLKQLAQRLAGAIPGQPDIFRQAWHMKQPCITAKSPGQDHDGFAVARSMSQSNLAQKQNVATLV